MKKISIMMDKTKKNFRYYLIYLISIIFLGLVLGEFYNIASGTGSTLRNFSLKWGVFFILFALFLFSLLFFFSYILWKPKKLKTLKALTISFRNRLGFFSWTISLVLLIIILWFFKYSLWGLVFTGVYFRLFVWLLLVIAFAILLGKDNEKLISYFPLLLSTFLSATCFALASVFANVVDYPFNLYWSDGNRLWDYSVMFGRHLYNYSADQPINAFISSGRQFLWGLPFLLPNTTILFNRFWSAFVLSFPYMVLGWITFKTKETKAREALLLSFLAFLFLNQGPIYTPLVLSAILVALAWERPLWLAIPLVAFAGYYAEITRYTWEFAPAIWAGMLSLNGSKLKGTRLVLFQPWGRAFILTFSGISIWVLAGPIAKLQITISEQSSLFIAILLLLIWLIQLVRKKHWNPSLWPKKAIYGTLFGLLIVGLILSNRITIFFSVIIQILKGTISGAQSSVSQQPLLWSRLFPNDTYPEGILGGLLIAILPLVIILFYLLKKKYWQPSLWQKLAMLGSLLPFLIVGLIISTKIGGGNNLHNLDMFLIALLFVAAIAWRNGGREWFLKTKEHPLWLRATLILLIALPALPSLSGMRPKLSLSQTEIEQVKILTDTERVETLPSTEEINDAIWFIRHAINDWEDEGEILFIDQRQLLTFGYVPKIPLVPEYEKKRMMNEAMSSNADYFAPYYDDLAAQRFSLIITEPLKVEIKDEEGSFAAENDLWTKWVAAPTLCYYEPLETLDNVYIQLLVPREETLDCSPYLP